MSENIKKHDGSEQVSESIKAYPLYSQIEKIVDIFTYEGYPSFGNVFLKSNESLIRIAKQEIVEERIDFIEVLIEIMRRLRDENDDKDFSYTFFNNFHEIDLKEIVHNIILRGFIGEKYKTERANFSRQIRRLLIEEIVTKDDFNTWLDNAEYIVFLQTEIYPRLDSGLSPLPTRIEKLEKADSSSVSSDPDPLYVFPDETDDSRVTLVQIDTTGISSEHPVSVLEANSQDNKSTRDDSTPDISVDESSMPDIVIEEEQTIPIARPTDSSIGEYLSSLPPLAISSRDFSISIPKQSPVPTTTIDRLDIDSPHTDAFYTKLGVRTAELVAMKPKPIKKYFILEELDRDGKVLDRSALLPELEAHEQGKDKNGKALPEFYVIGDDVRADHIPVNNPEFSIQGHQVDILTDPQDGEVKLRVKSGIVRVADYEYALSNINNAWAAIPQNTTFTVETTKTIDNGPLFRVAEIDIPSDINYKERLREVAQNIRSRVTRLLKAYSDIIRINPKGNDKSESLYYHSVLLCWYAKNHGLNIWNKPDEQAQLVRDAQAGKLQRVEEQLTNFSFDEALYNTAVVIPTTILGGDDEVLFEKTPPESVELSSSELESDESSYQTIPTKRGGSIAPSVSLQSEVTVVSAEGTVIISRDQLQQLQSKAAQENLSFDPPNPPRTSTSGTIVVPTEQDREEFKSSEAITARDALEKRQTMLQGLDSPENSNRMIFPIISLISFNEKNQPTIEKQIPLYSVQKRDNKGRLFYTIGGHGGCDVVLDNNRKYTASIDARISFDNERVEIQGLEGSTIAFKDSKLGLVASEPHLIGDGTVMMLSYISNKKPDTVESYYFTINRNTEIEKEAVKKFFKEKLERLMSEYSKTLVLEYGLNEEERAKNRLLPSDEILKLINELTTLDSDYKLGCFANDEIERRITLARGPLQAILSNIEKEAQLQNEEKAKLAATRKTSLLAQKVSQQARSEAIRNIEIINNYDGLILDDDEDPELAEVVHIGPAFELIDPSSNKNEPLLFPALLSDYTFGSHSVNVVELTSDPILDKKRQYMTKPFMAKLVCDLVNGKFELQKIQADIRPIQDGVPVIQVKDRFSIFKGETYEIGRYHLSYKGERYAFSQKKYSEIVGKLVVELLEKLIDVDRTTNDDDTAAHHEIVRLLNGKIDEQARFSIIHSIQNKYHEGIGKHCETLRKWSEKNPQRDAKIFPLLMLIAKLHKEYPDIVPEASIDEEYLKQMALRRTKRYILAHLDTRPPSNKISRVFGFLSNKKEQNSINTTLNETLAKSGAVDVAKFLESDLINIETLNTLADSEYVNRIKQILSVRKSIYSLVTTEFGDLELLERAFSLADNYLMEDLFSNEEIAIFNINISNNQSKRDINNTTYLKDYLKRIAINMARHTYENIRIPKEPEESMKEIKLIEWVLHSGIARPMDITDELSSTEEEIISKIRKIKQDAVDSQKRIDIKKNIDNINEEEALRLKHKAHEICTIVSTEASAKNRFALLSRLISFAEDLKNTTIQSEIERVYKGDLVNDWNQLVRKVATECCQRAVKGERAHALLKLIHNAERSGILNWKDIPVDRNKVEEGEVFEKYNKLCVEAIDGNIESIHELISINPEDITDQTERTIFRDRIRKEAITRVLHNLAEKIRAGEDSVYLQDLGQLIVEKLGYMPENLDDRDRETIDPLQLDNAK